MKNKKNNLYFAIAGILAPILWFVLVVVIGALEPGYSHMTQMMGILGGVGGIRGLAFNIGVSIVGILIIAFGIELHRSINKGKGSKIGPGIIILGGLGFIGACIFHCDLGCANFIVDRNFIGTMHARTAFIGGLGIGISRFFIFARLRKDPQWKNYKWFTRIMGILTNIPAVILRVTIFTIGAPKEIGGMIQRLGFIFPLIWIGIMSLKMLKLNTKKKEENI